MPLYVFLVGGEGLSNELRLNRKICFLLARGFLYYAEIKFCNQLFVQNLIQMKKKSYRWVGLVGQVKWK